MEITIKRFAIIKVIKIIPVEIYYYFMHLITKLRIENNKKVGTVCKGNLKTMKQNCMYYNIAFTVPYSFSIHPRNKGKE